MVALLHAVVLYIENMGVNPMKSHLKNPYFTAGVIADHIVQRVQPGNSSWTRTQKELILINQSELLLWHEILHVCIYLSIHKHI